MAYPAAVAPPFLTSPLLASAGVKHGFFDYRLQRLDPKVLDGWFARAGWEKVLNRGSPTFRALPDADKIDIDEKKARALILAETNLIKRPVLDTGDRLLFGFRVGDYESATAGR